MKNKRRLFLLIMFFTLPITLNFFSPYIIIDGLFNKIISGAFLVWTIMAVSSLFIGRAFCAYICPYGAWQMIIDRCIEKPLKKIKGLKILKYILGATWVFVIAFALISSREYKLNLFYLTEGYVSVDKISNIMGYFTILTLLAVLPLVLGKRATCYYLCPMSILNITGSKVKNKFNIPSLKLKAEPSNCKKCSACNKSCPMSINVMEKVQHNSMESSDCILCGECSKACKFGAVNRICGKDRVDRKVVEMK
ncbi:4Fe-4S binding protein [Clostridium fungisolvens]|uniref:4Fe-4S ferredoxin-type domain-containing protein n=1 Tax=Clostridium fungisolvens TaxID=1604897 RepID=A0A6V8SA35_9CLOT|nr:4Fe-4S binding protein [Clostridium fungisolvens]GFP74117.1 hypothetical protein bsdtw1_00156 [Clostridium fungisolvens]